MMRAEVAAFQALVRRADARGEFAGAQQFQVGGFEQGVHQVPSIIAFSRLIKSCLCRAIVIQYGR